MSGLLQVSSARVPVYTRPMGRNPSTAREFLERHSDLRAEFGQITRARACATRIAQNRVIMFSCLD